MNILSPSILSADFTRLGEQLAQMDRAGAQYVHIDVMDGMFVPSISYGMPLIASIRKATDRLFDVHLMIERPERYIDDFIACGADMITFHLEAAGETPAGKEAAVKAIIDKLHKKGKKAGIAIKPNTPAKAVQPYLRDADMVLVMTVEPGFGGQAYLDFCTEKIRSVRAMADACGRNLDIQVDGGINLNTLPVVLEAGANVIVAGSSLLSGNMEANIREFLAVMQQKEKEDGV